MGAELKPVERGLGVFEKYLTVWVVLCILAGIWLGRVAPGVATYLDGLSIYVGGAPVVSIPIAISASMPAAMECCLIGLSATILSPVYFRTVSKAP